MSTLPGQVSAVTPLGDVIDGSPRPRVRKKPASAPETPYSVTWQCTDCGSRHTRALLSCLDCGKEFTAKIDFRRHVQTCDKSTASVRGTSVRIREEVLADGSVRYRARGVHIGTSPVTGKRMQRTITASSRQAVADELAVIGHQVEQGTYRKPWKGTVGDLIEDYLASAPSERIRLDRRQALEPAGKFFGRTQARLIGPDDIGRYRDHMLARGRRAGGRPGSALSARSVTTYLCRLQAAFDLAERDGRIQGNPCRLVPKPILTT
jgi:hypothetical protein